MKKLHQSLYHTLADVHVRYWCLVYLSNKWGNFGRTKSPNDQIGLIGHVSIHKMTASIHFFIHMSNVRSYNHTSMAKGGIPTRKALSSFLLFSHSVRSGIRRNTDRVQRRRGFLPFGPS
jgi:hypothetical protein